MSLPSVNNEVKSEQSLTSQGQRRINILWEVTQSIIATIVTCSTVYVASRLASANTGNESAFLLLSNGFFLVIGFYFGRTNHQRIGGVGEVTLGR